MMQWCIGCMDWKKFAGPAILIGIAILLHVGMKAYGDAKYDEGDTVESGDMIAICGTYLLLVLLCLGSIVWFAFALGGKTQKTVFLAGLLGICFSLHRNCFFTHLRGFKKNLN